MKPIILKKDEIVVKQDDFGFLATEFIRDALRPKGPRWMPEYLDKKVREWWPMLEEYYQRQVMTTIEVAISLDKPPRYNREPMEHKEMWQRIVKDLRPARSEFSIDYHCHKCKTRNVKLWRGVHGCSDNEGHELLCAACLAPDLKVSERGRAEDESIGFETDQIKGWLPAVPVGDTYWGYSSVPSQDVEWWIGLPTYLSK